MDTTAPRLISVVIPTFNRGDCVAEAVRSALSQTGGELEVIVVDDGSTDNTAEVLAAFGDKIQVIRQKNSGVSAARNRGIQAARGEWVAFLDSDDLWLPGKLAAHVQAINAHPEAVCSVVDAELEMAEGEFVSLFELRGKADPFRQRGLRSKPLLDVLDTQFGVWSCCVRRDAVLRIGGFPEDFSIHEDVQMLSRLSLEGPFYIDCFPGVRVRRVGDRKKALSYQHQQERVKSCTKLCQLYERLLGIDSLAGPERTEVERRLCGAYFELSVALNAESRAAEAAEALRTSRRHAQTSKQRLRGWVASLAGVGLADRIWRVLSPPAKGQRRSELDQGRVQTQRSRT